MSQKSKFLKESMKPNWNFQRGDGGMEKTGRGGGGYTKKTFCGRIMGIS